MFNLSEKSLKELGTVKPELQAVVVKAIQVTKVDFGVIEGIRTLEAQKELVEKGVSQIMKSKHLTGDAVDLMAYIGKRGSWELNIYDEIADAMKQAATELKVPIRWGGAWNVPDICMWPGTMEQAMTFYIDDCRQKKKRPFIDAPHFEIAD